MNILTRASRLNFNKLKTFHTNVVKNGKLFVGDGIVSNNRTIFKRTTQIGCFVLGATSVTILAKNYLIAEAHCESFVEPPSVVDDLEDGKCEDENEEKEEEDDDEVKTKKDQKFPWKLFFWEYVYPEIFRLTLAMGWAILGAVINMKIPLELGSLINKLNQSDGDDAMPIGYYMETMKEPLKNLVFLYAMQGVTTFSYISLLSNVGENIAAHLRTDLYESYLRQDMTFFDEHKTGALIDRLTSDVQDFKSSFKMCVSQGLKSSMQTVGCVMSLYITSAKMTALLCTTLPLLMMIGTKIGSSLRIISKNAQEESASATAKASEVLANFKTVRSFANEKYELDEYEKLVQQSCVTSQNLGFGIGMFQGLSNVALNGVVLTVIYGGGYLVSRNEINAGQLMSFLVSAQIIQRSLTSLSVLFGAGVRGAAAGSRVFEYLSLQPTVELHGGLIIPKEELCGNISFNNIKFSYPQRPDQVVLNGVDLDIDSNSTLALVGPSGGGKSTIASLLERFYDINEGSITLDGHDIRDLDPSWLRGKVIGFISQEPVLFSGSISENIRYGKPNASDKEVQEAARLSNAHNFITNFPHGYNTLVGERGMALSGGQKQRIAIARALLRDPVVLILDEATSALDAESESLVQQALDDVMKGRTVLVIAHRLSTIRKAHQIAVIKNGKIVEVGSHEELEARKSGVYSELIQLQQEKGTEEGCT